MMERFPPREKALAEAGPGLVHLGPGAFFRAHLGWYTHHALRASGGDWGIVLASLRSTDVIDALVAQGGQYTLVTRGAEVQAEVIGSVVEGIAAAREPEVLMARLTAPETRIVSMTLTEKAYGIAREGGMDAAHPAVAADLVQPRAPRGVLGLLVEALRQRFAAGVAPFTVLCCDNLPENGVLLREAVLGFAARIDAGLHDRIAAEVCFPSTMVDRITPAATAETRAEAARLTGVEDPAAIETEPFSQWVIEDRFAQGRPDWASAGALFVEDVRPFEEMKLRMLNGAHSLIAYAGHHAGCTYVRDAMARPDLAALVARHMAAAAQTLDAVPGIDLESYAAELVARFRNPAIAHRTYQIAMDGTEKLPQRIFAPAVTAQARGQDLAPFAFACAAWMYHAATAPELQDPRAEAIRAGVPLGASEAEAVASALEGLEGFVPAVLLADPAWRAGVRQALAQMLAEGMAAAIAHEAASLA